MHPYEQVLGKRQNILTEGMHSFDFASHSTFASHLYRLALFDRFQISRVVHQVLESPLEPRGETSRVESHEALAKVFLLGVLRGREGAPRAHARSVARAGEDT